mmetsp:Transcript_52550/g.115260  ORF Transcript_52550/g.115260 Transcript_52550/m.115260 type:complete len:119 (+) Transcript_52550:48-404(+)
MLFLSRALYKHHSKRIVVRLESAAQTGYFYITEKSPLKKDYKLAFRKYDPLVNARVMFYESPNLVSRRKMMKHKTRQSIRFTGRGIEPLIRQAQVKMDRQGLFPATWMERIQGGQQQQ